MVIKELSPFLSIQVRADAFVAGKLIMTVMPRQHRDRSGPSYGAMARATHSTSLPFPKGICSLTSSFSKALLMKLHPVSLGAITQLYAGTAPEASKLNGKARTTFSIHTISHPFIRCISLPVSHSVGPCWGMPRAGGTSGSRRASVDMAGGTGDWGSPCS